MKPLRIELCFKFIRMVIIIGLFSFLTIGCGDSGGGGGDDGYNDDPQAALITWYEDSDGDGYGDPN